MTDQQVARFIDKIARLAPLSPAFLACRDDLEHFGASASTRLAQAIAAVASCAE